MTQSAAQWSAFAREVAKNRVVWTIRDDGGYPAPVNSDGKRAMPFWSSATRVRTIIESIPDYAQFEPVEISWDDFKDRWLPGLARDGLLAGINWTGERATGYDVEPSEVLRRIELEISQR